MRHEEGRIAKRRENGGRMSETKRIYHLRKKGWSWSRRKSLAEQCSAVAAVLTLRYSAMALKLKETVGIVLRRTGKASLLSLHAGS